MRGMFATKQRATAGIAVCKRLIHLQHNPGCWGKKSCLEAPVLHSLSAFPSSRCSRFDTHQLTHFLPCPVPFPHPQGVFPRINYQTNDLPSHSVSEGTFTMTIPQTLSFSANTHSLWALELPSEAPENKQFSETSETDIRESRGTCAMGLEARQNRVSFLPLESASPWKRNLVQNNIKKILDRKVGIFDPAPGVHRILPVDKSHTWIVPGFPMSCMSLLVPWLLTILWVLAFYDHGTTKHTKHVPITVTKLCVFYSEPHPCHSPMSPNLTVLYGAASWQGLCFFPLCVFHPCGNFRFKFSRTLIFTPWRWTKKRMSARFLKIENCRTP